MNSNSNSNHHNSFSVPDNHHSNDEKSSIIRPSIVNNLISPKKRKLEIQSLTADSPLLFCLRQILESFNGVNAERKTPEFVQQTEKLYFDLKKDLIWINQIKIWLEQDLVMQEQMNIAHQRFNSNINNASNFQQDGLSGTVVSSSGQGGSGFSGAHQGGDNVNHVFSSVQDGDNYLYENSENLQINFEEPPNSLEVLDQLVSNPNSNYTNVNKIGSILTNDSAQLYKNNQPDNDISE